MLLQAKHIDAICPLHSSPIRTRKKRFLNIISTFKNSFSHIHASLSLLIVKNSKILRLLQRDSAPEASVLIDIFARPTFWLRFDARYHVILPSRISHTFIWPEASAEAGCFSALSSWTFPFSVAFFCLLLYPLLHSLESRTSLLGRPLSLSFAKGQKRKSVLKSSKKRRKRSWAANV